MIIGLFGCFGDAEDPVIDEPQDQPEDAVPDFFDVANAPVVKLVVDDRIWDGDNDKKYLVFHAEIEDEAGSLPYHLFIYVVTERHHRGEENEWGGKEDPGPPEIKKYLMIIEKGNTISGQYTVSGSTEDHRDLIVKMLPSKDLLGDGVPSFFDFGKNDDGTSRGFAEIPEGHRFKPYLIGTPSEISSEE